MRVFPIANIRAKNQKKEAKMPSHQVQPTLYLIMKIN